MKLTADRTQIDVPGSIVGFGTGYSSLVVGVGPVDHVSVVAVAGASQVSGIGLGARPADPSTHPTVVAVSALLDRVGAPQVGVQLSFRAKIPRGSGLGARSAEIVTGLVAATRLLGSPDELDLDFLLQMAQELGADRQRALVAFMGGACVRLGEQDEVRFEGKPWSDLQLGAFVPGFVMDETKDQEPEPRAVKYADAQRSAASLALQMGLLSGTVYPDREILKAATQNALRKEVASVRSPASHSLANWFQEQSIPAFVTGSGPAVVTCGVVPEEISEAALVSGWTPHPLELATTGALNGSI